MDVVLVGSLYERVQRVLEIRTSRAGHVTSLARSLALQLRFMEHTMLSCGALVHHSQRIIAVGYGADNMGDAADYEDGEDTLSGSGPDAGEDDDVSEYSGSAEPSQGGQGRSSRGGTGGGAEADGGRAAPRRTTVANGKRSGDPAVKVTIISCI